MRQTSRGGRPPVGEVEALRVRLLQEIERHGFENVTMAQLAASVDASARTLHRYFPSKADIVWGGIESSIVALREVFQREPVSSDALTSIAVAMRRVLDRNAEDLAVMKSRLRLIALSPDLRSNRTETFEGWRHELIAFIARLRGEEADSLVSVATGAAVHAAITDALSWWARRDDGGDPADCIVIALDGLRDTLGARPAPSD